MCGLRFLDAVERSSDAALGGDDIGAALEKLRWQSDRRGRRHRRQLLRDLHFRRRIPADEQFERAQRLLARILDLPKRVPVGAQIGTRFSYGLVVTDADAQPVLG